MAKILIIGGGWAGCSAAIAAKKTGADVLLTERTDLLLGLGNVGGIMRNNGRFTAAEECIAMGAGELFAITDACSTHRNKDFPGHGHASFYDPEKVEPAVRGLLADMGVETKLTTRITDIRKTEKRIESVTSAEGENFDADVFVDCTGTTGPMGNCMEFGNGCSMCVLRCPSFGPRVSISAKAGGSDYYGLRDDGTPGAFSGSCKLDKGSLSRELQRQLDEEGVAIVPLPEHLVNKSKLTKKVCRQYALRQFAENIILIDTGHAKMMTPFFPLEELRQVPGFEKARYLDPYAGGKGNSIRYMAVTERDETLRVRGVENLFCGGEKAGPFIGHTEAIVTGSLAGFNAGCMAGGEELLALHPEETAIGAFLHYEKPGGGMFTFAGDAFFDHMKAVGLYTTDKKQIERRIADAGLTGRYNAFL
ncbi:MAG: FAD-dependent oxidoreductase [Firmicutes bacterium]|nr:FAD-dependent oxidoreductase [Bacillota bacterium]